MKKRSNWFTIHLILIALAGSSACALRSPARSPRNAPAPARAEKTVIVYEGRDGKTALELLKERARVRVSSGPLGELVEEIDGYRNGNGYYLIFYVNGSMARTGAASYATRNGERIEWKLVGPRKQ